MEPEVPSSNIRIPSLISKGKEQSHVEEKSPTKVEEKVEKKIRGKLLHSDQPHPHILETKTPHHLRRWPIHPHPPQQKNRNQFPERFTTQLA